MRLFEFVESKWTTLMTIDTVYLGGGPDLWVADTAASRPARSSVY